MESVKNMKIETSRLIIKPYKEDDLMNCFNLTQDEKLFKYLDMDIMSFEEYRGLFDWLIDSCNKGYDEDFKYSFNITLKESGTHIGWCGIGVSNCFPQYKEIYYLIGRNNWGKGYAKEATVALLDYSFNTIGLDEITAMCKPENIASRKVIENIMMQECINWCKENGVEQLELEVVTQNDRAVSMYKSFGFETYGTKKHALKYSDGTYADEYSMILFFKLHRQLVSL